MSRGIFSTLPAFSYTVSLWNRSWYHANFTAKHTFVRKLKLWENELKVTQKGNEQVGISTCSRATKILMKTLSREWTEPPKQLCPEVKRFQSVNTCWVQVKKNRCKYTMIPYIPVSVHYFDRHKYLKKPHKYLDERDWV